jgi:hypothetical protein
MLLTKKKKKGSCILSPLVKVGQFELCDVSCIAFLFRSYFYWVLLTNVSGALVKKFKNNKFYIGKNVTYALKKLATQVPRQFYHFLFLN